jgi:hypothetical protein
MLAAQPADRMPGVPILLRELQRLEEGLGLDSGAKAGPDAATASVPPPAEEPHDRIRIPDEDFDYRRAMMERESRRERSSGSPKAIFSVLALALAVLGVGYAGFMYYSPGSSEKGIAARRVQEALTASGPAAPAPVTEASKEPVAAFGPWQASPPRFADDRQAEQKSSVVGVPRPIAPPPVAEPIKAEQESSGTLFGLKMPPKPVAAEPDPLPQTESLVPRAAVPEQQPRGTAQLILAVSPGGELYINGEHHGTTPPATTFDLEPGMHRIEVRSGSRTPYVTYMTVEPGDVRRIRHDFGAKPSRPPG